MQTTIRQHGKTQHSPTLNTIRMVEKVLAAMPDSVMTVAELKKQLPKQVNHNTLMQILEYLEESGKVHVGLKGITWVYNTNPNLAKVIREGLRL